MNFKKMILAAVAMVFAFSAHSGELVKKKDSFAADAPPNFAMAHAKEGEPCHQSGDIGMSLDGLILSCQSDSWGRLKKQGGYYLIREDKTVLGDNFPNPVTGSFSCPAGFTASWLPTVFQIVHLHANQNVHPHYYLVLCL